MEDYCKGGTIKKENQPVMPSEGSIKNENQPMMSSGDYDQSTAFKTNDVKFPGVSYEVGEPNDEEADQQLMLKRNLEKQNRLREFYKQNRDQVTFSLQEKTYLDNLCSFCKDYEMFNLAIDPIRDGNELVNMTKFYLDYYRKTKITHVQDYCYHLLLQLNERIEIQEIKKEDLIGDKEFDYTLHVLMAGYLEFAKHQAELDGIEDEEEIKDYFTPIMEQLQKLYNLIH